MRLALFAFLAFVAVAAVWLVNGREARHGLYPKGSSFDEGDDGLALAREYLERTGVRVRTLTLPLAQAELPANAVVLRIAPQGDRDEPGRSVAFDDDDAGVQARPAPRALTEAEESFVRAGGRLVLAVSGEISAELEQKVSPLLPAVARLETLEGRTLPPALWVDAEPVFERGDAPSVARRRLGKGEAWLVAEPEIFSAALLSKADNLAFLAALTFGGRPVWFDETVHGLGHQGGTLQLLGRFGFGPALVLAVLALCAAFWRRSALLGPAADRLRDRRSEAVELVDSLASLYQGALTRGEALRLYRARIVREIGLRLLVDERRAAAVLAQYAGGDVPEDDPKRLSKSEFTRRLHHLASACERFRDDHHSRRR